jgi:hypothetical protein
MQTQQQNALNKRENRREARGDYFNREALGLKKRELGMREEEIGAENRAGGLIGNVLSGGGTDTSANVAQVMPSFQQPQIQQPAQQFPTDYAAAYTAPQAQSIQAPTNEVAGGAPWKAVDAQILGLDNLVKQDPSIARTKVYKDTYDRLVKSREFLAQRGEKAQERKDKTFTDSRGIVRYFNTGEPVAKQVPKAPEGMQYNDAGQLEEIPGYVGMKSRIAKAGAMNVNVGMNATDAAKAELLNQGISDIEEFKGILMPNGKIDREIVLGMNTPGFAGVPGTDSRMAYSLIYNSIEAKLRAESGAAVPEQEVQRMAARFIPSPLDTDETIRSKVRRMEAFLRGSFSRIKGAGEPSTQKGQPQTGSAPKGVDQKLWDALTPEEKKLWN